MLRLVWSFVAAAVISASAFELVMTLRGSPAFTGPHLTNILTAASVTLVFTIVAGLPWLPVIRKHAWLGAWQIISLAAMMACTPYILYCLYVLATELGMGYSAAVIADRYGRDIPSYLSFFLAMGILSGGTIWLLGVRNNKALLS